MARKQREEAAVVTGHRYVVSGKGPRGEKIRRVYPTEAEAERDAAQSRKRRCKDVLITKVEVNR